MDKQKKKKKKWKKNKKSQRKPRDEDDCARRGVKRPTRVCVRACVHVRANEERDVHAHMYVCDTRVCVYVGLCIAWKRKKRGRSGRGKCVFGEASAYTTHRHTDCSEHTHTY